MFCWDGDSHLFGWKYFAIEILKIMSEVLLLGGKLEEDWSCN